MAYTYVSALVRGRGTDALWKTINAGNLDLNVLFNTYQYMYLTLTNPLYQGNIYLDMSSVRSTIPLSIPGMTVNQWLASLGNESLPTVTDPPVITSNAVLFRDGWQAGYSVRPTDLNVAPDVQMPPGALNDLLLSRPNTNYASFYAKALVTINGLVHRTGTAPSNAGIYVEGGMYTSRQCNDNQIGILSFENVGDITIVPITDSMLTNNRTIEPFGRYVYVHLNQSLVGKSLLLVLAGHLHVMDEAYDIIAENVIRINFDRIPWPALFFDALASIDTTSLHWSSTQNNPHQISIEDLYSNTLIEAFLQLSQTFLVVVNAPDLYIVRHYTERTKLPGRWTCSAGLQGYPLISALGKLVEYSPVWENSLFVLRGATIYDLNYNYETTDWFNDLSVTPNLYRAEPIMHPQAYLLEFGTQSVAA